jgi:hypothetical protein
MHNKLADCSAAASNRQVKQVHPTRQHGTAVKKWTTYSCLRTSEAGSISILALAATRARPARSSSARPHRYGA